MFLQSSLEIIFGVEVGSNADRTVYALKEGDGQGADLIRQGRLRPLLLRNHLREDLVFGDVLGRRQRTLQLRTELDHVCNSLA